MANYATLISAIQSVITANGNNEITGPILQQTLVSIINSLGSGYQFIGIATPSTTPGTPDQRVFYIGSAGTYPNFGPAVVPDGNMGIFYYDSGWHFGTVAFPIGTGTITETNLATALVNKLFTTGYKFAGIATPSTTPGTPNQNVFYVGGPGTYQNFGETHVVNEGLLGFFEYNNGWTFETAQVGETNTVKYVPQTLTESQKQQARANIGAVADGSPGGEEFVDVTELTKYSYVISASGTWTAATGTNLSRSVYIELANITKIRITMTGGNGVIAFLRSRNFGSGTAVDFATGYPSRITLTSGTTTEYNNIPEDARYLYIAANNSDGTEILPRYTIYVTRLSNMVLRTSDVVDNLDSQLTDAPLSAKQGYVLNSILETISKAIFELPYSSADRPIEYDTGNVASSGSTTTHTNYIDISGFSYLIYSRGKASSTTTKAGMAFYDADKVYISGQRFVLGQDTSGYIETKLTIPTGAKFARFTIWNSHPEFYVVGMGGPVESFADKFDALNNRVGGSLSGKKISVIGDSITCFGTEAQVRAGDYTTPFWKVLSVDVGQNIQSWVTWLDVYTSVDSTTRTNKTIGGVTLTPEMIGTLQTFTPVAADVGKCIGVPRWASSYTSKPWWQVLIEKTGAVFCANASWSGSRAASIPVGASRHDAFVLSEMYSDYTLGRVKNRDENGNVITPDIIIIYRGTNDFIANDPAGNETLDTPDMKTFTAITDEHNFTQCYIYSILRLRALYPNAVIVLCTLNVFKKRNISHFPSNNGSYTEPDYNNKIREIANIMGCGVIEFDKDGINWNNCYPTYISDSSSEPLHPNTAGHQVMGLKAIADIQYCL